MIVRLVLAAGVALTAAACGSSNPAPSPSPSNGTPVSIVAGSSTLTTTAYAPNPINIAVGGTVTWTNNDNTAHTSSGNNGGWDSGSIAPGGSFSRTFTAAGAFPYHCTIHPGMVGTVNVQ
jgi:plastocyanin